MIPFESNVYVKNENVKYSTPYARMGALIQSIFLAELEERFDKKRKKE